MIFPDCSGVLNQQAVCHIQNGQPWQTFTQTGIATPEGAVIGLVVGLHQYWATDTSKMYVFNGVVGANTGWVILN